jgi:hypothetical protein
MDEVERFMAEDEGWWDRNRTRWDGLSNRTRIWIVRVSLALLLVAAVDVFNLVSRLV